jgi:hypothetical protein
MTRCNAMMMRLMCMDMSMCMMRRAQNRQSLS